MRDLIAVIVVVVVVDLPLSSELLHTILVYPSHVTGICQIWNSEPWAGPMELQNARRHGSWVVKTAPTHTELTPKTG